MHLIDRVAHTNQLTARSAVEKVAFGLGMLLLAVTLPPWPGAVIVLAVLIAATLGVARVPPRSYAKLLAAPLLFLVTGVAPLLVTIGFGGPWLVHFGLAAGGPALALRVSLRSMAGVSCLLFLALSTPVPQLLGVMRRFGVPAVVTEVALLVYRYIWVFVDTVGAIRVAQSSRLGYRSLARSYRSLGMLAGTFFGRTLARARAMDHGLEARNWQGELTVLDDGVAASRVGVAFVAAVMAATVATTLLLGLLW
jgi:cobalt/nickel transport system permease protein